ncbi:hypothetical protein ACRRTK_011681 [Alexandromys fortis]
MSLIVPSPGTVSAVPTCKIPFIEHLLTRALSLCLVYFVSAQRETVSPQGALSQPNTKESVAFSVTQRDADLASVGTAVSLCFFSQTQMLRLLITGSPWKSQLCSSCWLDLPLYQEKPLSSA